MKYFDWDFQKDEQLKRERDISFEDILIAIDGGNLLDVIEHPNKKKYPNQELFVVDINDYAYLVPFAEDEEKYFLKTIFPSRKMTQKYIINKKKI
ncbi:MAG: DUF4258 domain-containing protein [bacterium]|nr:DUF4258 domain-containing protein [bacterium]